MQRDCTTPAFLDRKLIRHTFWQHLEDARALHDSCRALVCFPLLFFRQVFKWGPEAQLFVTLANLPAPHR